MTTIAQERLTLEATELDRRPSAGGEVRLLWIPEVNELLVEELDKTSGELALRQVPQGKGNDAFQHPSLYDEASPAYSYTVTRGVIELPKQQ